MDTLDTEEICSDTESEASNMTPSGVRWSIRDIGRHEKSSVREFRKL